MNPLSNQSFPDFIHDVNYITVWDLEKSIDISSWKVWLEMNQFSVIYVSMAYVVAAFSGQYLMRDRKPFQLKEALAAWNFMLGAFSIIGFVRTAPELFYILNQKDGFYQSVCSNDHLSMTSAFWGLLMALSKVAEFGDTAFIVLKKKPLSFLNWGHHSLALCGAITTYGAGNPTWRWLMIMNFFVHSFMYTYFGLKTLNFNIPKRISIYITAIQLTQMFIGTVVTGYSIFVKSNGMECNMPLWQTYIAFIGYATFTYLFGSFFVKSYMTTSRSKVTKSD